MIGHNYKLKTLNKLTNKACVAMFYKIDYFASKCLIELYYLVGE